MIPYQQEFLTIMAKDRWINQLLGQVATLKLRDWCLAGGLIRGAVWDHLHGYTQRTPPSDIDVLFFDRNCSPELDAEIEAQLKAINPSAPWEVVNQAHVHTYNDQPPYESTTEALSHWAETPNALGLTLSPGGELGVLAPLGLEDLFDLRVRPNITSPRAREVYRSRMATKGWQEKWPKLVIEPHTESKTDW